MGTRCCGLKIIPELTRDPELTGGPDKSDKSDKFVNLGDSDNLDVPETPSMRSQSPIVLEFSGSSGESGNSSCNSTDSTDSSKLDSDDSDEYCLAQSLTGFCGILYEREFPEPTRRLLITDEELCFHKFAEILEEALRRYELRGCPRDAGAVPIPLRTPTGMMVLYRVFPQRAFDLLLQWRRRLPVRDEMNEMIKILYQ